MPTNSERILENTARIKALADRLESTEIEDVTEEVQAQNAIVANIQDIMQGMDKEVYYTADATATPSDIVSGKTAYIEGGKITGEYEPLDVSDTTATAGDVAVGKVFYDKDGVKTEGSGNIAVELEGIDEIDIPSDFDEISNPTGDMIVLSTSKNDYFCFSRNTSHSLPIYYLDRKNKVWIDLFGVKSYSQPNSKYFVLDNGDVVFTFQGLQYFDSTDKILINIEGGIGGNVNSWLYDDDKLFYTGNFGVYIFHPNTKNIVKASDTTTGYINASPKLLKTEYGIFIISTSTIFKFNEGSQLFESIYKVTGGTLIHTYIENVGLFIRGNQLSSFNDVLVYNPKTNTMVVAYTGLLSTSILFFNSSNNVTFMYSGSNSQTGILKYNQDTMSFESITTEGYSFSIYEDSLKNIFISSSNSTPKIYTIQDELMQISENQYTLVIRERNNQLFATYSSSAYLGVYKFDYNTNQFKKVLDIGYATFYLSPADIMMQFGIYLTFGNSSYKGIYKFNETTEMFDNVYTAGYGNTNYHIDRQGNLWLFNYNNAPIKYNGISYNKISLSGTILDFTAYEDENCFLLYRKYSTGSYGTEIYIVNDYTSITSLTTKYINPHIYLENGLIKCRGTYINKVSYYDLNSKKLIVINNEYDKESSGRNGYKLDNSQQRASLGGGTTIIKNNIYKYFDNQYSSIGAITNNNRVNEAKKRLLYFTEESYDN